ncbi:MAG: hypothetical protein SGARI_005480 [Bacillariaceae sp.]
MMDDSPDHAGNYAASLADMANTPRHDAIARYLRQECSTARMTSCAVLGVPITATETEIRKAYLNKAREVHPDKCRHGNSDDTAEKDNDDDNKFQELQRAYKHLTEEQGYGNQMAAKQDGEGKSMDDAVQNNDHGDNLPGDEDPSSFKARLMAVLLEYGDKGMDLSNIKKKWNQVWGPDVPFPSQIVEHNYSEHRDGKKKKQQPKKIPLSELLHQLAGDVIKLDRDEENGGIKVYCKSCSRETVALAAKEGKVAVG